MRIAYLSRTENVSASHRLHSTALSDAENALQYGKCNRPNGHGHNYKVEVTLRGPVDPHTGMVLNLAILKDAIKECIAEPLDHRNLDLDVGFFRDSGIPSTTENLAIHVYDSIKEWMDSRGGKKGASKDTAVNGHHLHQDYDGSLLYEVKIYETDKNVIIYRGE